MQFLFYFGRMDLNYPIGGFNINYPYVGDEGIHDVSNQEHEEVDFEGTIVPGATTVDPIYISP